MQLVKVVCGDQFTSNCMNIEMVIISLITYFSVIASYNARYTSKKKKKVTWITLASAPPMED